MRLIDADAMLETLKRKYPQWYTGKPKDSWMHYAWLVYHQAVENAPTIDAVPVVRCKDCRHAVDYYHEGDYYCSNPKWGLNLNYFGGSWEFYCADAERRNNE